MHSIFSDNTTKLSIVAEVVYEPSKYDHLSLSDGLYMAMMESTQADIALFEMMIKADMAYTQLESTGVHESALATFHEGVLSKIGGFLKKLIDGFIKAAKWIWNKIKQVVVAALNKILDLIIRRTKSAATHESAIILEVEHDSDKYKNDDSEQRKFAHWWTADKAAKDRQTVANEFIDRDSRINLNAPIYWYVHEDYITNLYGHLFSNQQAVVQELINITDENYRDSKSDKMKILQIMKIDKDVLKYIQSGNGSYDELKKYLTEKQETTAKAVFKDSKGLIDRIVEVRKAVSYFDKHGSELEKAVEKINIMTTTTTTTTVSSIPNSGQQIQNNTTKNELNMLTQRLQALAKSFQTYRTIYLALAKVVQEYYADVNKTLVAIAHACLTEGGDTREIIAQAKEEKNQADERARIAQQAKEDRKRRANEKKAAKDAAAKQKENNDRRQSDDEYYRTDDEYYKKKKEIDSLKEKRNNGNMRAKDRDALDESIKAKERELEEYTAKKDRERQSEFEHLKKTQNMTREELAQRQASLSGVNMRQQERERKKILGEIREYEDKLNNNTNLPPDERSNNERKLRGLRDQLKKMNGDITEHDNRNNNNGNNNRGSQGNNGNNSGSESSSQSGKFSRFEVKDRFGKKIATIGENRTEQDVINILQGAFNRNNLDQNAARKILMDVKSKTGYALKVTGKVGSLTIQHESSIDNDIYSDFIHEALMHDIDEAFYEDTTCPYPTTENDQISPIANFNHFVESTFKSLMKPKA